MLEKVETKQEQATCEGRFFYDKTLDPAIEASKIASKQICEYVLGMFACRDNLVKASDDEVEDRRMKLYDIEASVRASAQRTALQLEELLPVGMHDIGNSKYMVIDDVHCKAGNSNWIILLADERKVSFREPRGLAGDDDMSVASYEDHKQLLEDVRTASQTESEFQLNSTI